MKTIAIILFFSYFIFGCSQSSAKLKNTDSNTIKNHTPEQNSSLALQPMEWEDIALLDSIKIIIEKFYDFDVDILPAISLPIMVYNASRNRYRADSLLKYLLAIKPEKYDFITGLTDKDISCTTLEYEDWGVFGLGYMPGKSSVISSFRLKRNFKSEMLYRERIYKVILHEIGHNINLDHCTVTNCLMQESDNTLTSLDNEKLKMCDHCQKLMKELLK